MISVIMANYNGERFLRRSIGSVLAQTHGDLEVIVSDDGSTDGSVEVVRELADKDSRVRLLADGSNGGPARARNRALEAAQGEWVAIVDSDDLLHPQRLEHLLAVAADRGADAVADNLLHFADDKSASVSFLFEGGVFDERFYLTPEMLVRADAEASGLPNFGYLKPMINRRRLGSLRYDERLKIGEDYDFMLRFLLTGASFTVVPEPSYLYRRHAGSISHRLSVSAMTDMIEAQQSLEAQLGDTGPELGIAFAERMSALRRGLNFERLVASIKDRQVSTALELIAREPRLVTLLMRSLRERLSRKITARKKQNQPPAEPPLQTIFVTDAGPNSAYSTFNVASIESEWLIEQVPAFPVGHEGDSRSAILQTARRLAALCQKLRATLICDGAAGRYAAGFVPFDHDLEEAAPEFLRQRAAATKPALAQAMPIADAA
jgi:succinoglycan biosynthesis protein ExoO